MIKLIRLLFGYVTFSFSGGFENDFLDECFSKEIMLRNIRINDDVLLADCLPREYKKLHSIAHNNGGKVSIKRKSGLIFVFDKILSRKGLALGIIFGVMLYCFLSSFIWQIEVVGNEKISQEDILSFLNSQGLSTGVLWKNVDKDYVEDIMMGSFEDVSWVHINRFGTTARVEISETTQKPQMVDNEKITNLKSTKDAVITFARVYDGWQEKFVGEAVTKGETLVSGVYESEHAEENMYAHASGEFIGKVQEDVSYTISRTQEYKSYISDKDYKAIYFFGLYIPLYIGKIPNQNADKTREIEYLYINSVDVPIGIVTTKVEKYSIESRVLDDSQLLDLANKTIDNDLKNQFDTILERDIEFTINTNDITAFGNVTVLESIGQEVDLVSDNN